MICVGVHTLHHIICHGEDNRVDFGPVVEAGILVFVELADLLVLDALELQRNMSVLVAFL